MKDREDNKSPEGESPPVNGAERCEEEPAGIPHQTPRRPDPDHGEAATEEKPADTNPPDDEPADQEDEMPAGTPPQPARGVRDVTEEDRRNIREKKERNAEAEFAEELESLTRRPFGRWFVRLAYSLLLLTAAVLLLFVLTQTVSFLSSAAALPRAGRYAAFGAFFLIAFVLGICTIRLGVQYFRLRENHQIPFSGLKALSERRELQRVAQRKLKEACKRLKGYLEDYPLDAESDNCRAMKAWLGEDGEEVVEKLRESRERLLDSRRFVSPGDWIGTFRRDFQGQLDTVGKKRIERHALRAGVATAVSPKPLLDTAFVLYHGQQVLKDLCRVYQVRLDGVSTAVMLSQILVSAYVAGRTDELEPAIEEGTEKVLRVLGGDSISKVPVVGSIFAKGTAGGVNWFIVRRLGRRIQRLLQPVATR